MMTKQYTVSSTNAIDDDWSRAVLLADRRAKLELRIIEIWLRNHRRGTAIAVAAGVTVDAFDQDDARCITAVLLSMPDATIDLTLVWIKRLLIAENLWDASAPRFSTGMRHSDATLARMAARAGHEDPDTLPGLIAVLLQVNALAGRARQGVAA